MREIKFRGKRVDNGEWVYGFVGRIDCYESGKQYEETVIIEELKYDDGDYYVQEFIYADPVIPETVGQYTGLKDKNGVEIYEGDVVWCRAGEHQKGTWEYEKQFIVEYGWSQSMWEMSLCDEIEVIGNIHDNPELMEGEQ